MDSLALAISECRCTRRSTVPALAWRCYRRVSAGAISYGVARKRHFGHWFGQHDAQPARLPNAACAALRFTICQLVCRTSCSQRHSRAAGLPQPSAHAVHAHPSQEHLLPFFVALGAAGETISAERFYSGIDDYVIAMDAYAFYQGEKP